MDFRLAAYAFLLSLGASASPLHGVRPPMLLGTVRSTHSWAPVPEVPATMIARLLATRIGDPETITALIAQERRVCFDFVGHRTCWDPRSASSRERLAVTELACRTLRTRYDALEDQLRQEDFERTGTSLHLTSTFQEAIARLRHDVGGILRAAGVPMRELEEQLRATLAGAFPVHGWSLEAVDAFDRARRALGAFNAASFAPAFAQTRRLLRAYQKRGGELRPVVSPESDPAQEHRLGGYERRTCIGQKGVSGEPCPLLALEEELSDALQREWDRPVTVRLFVHGRSPLNPSTFDPRTDQEGRPQPYELDLERFDPDLQVHIAPDQTLHLRMHPDGKGLWTFVPQAYVPSRESLHRSTVHVKPFEKLTDRQIACLAGWHTAKLFPPPAVPEWLPSVAEIRGRIASVSPVETLRMEGLQTLRTHLRVPVPMNGVFPTEEMIPVEQASFQNFLFPRPTVPEAYR